jgi:alpha-tubulin suppressor-like RCC1 family protein
VFGFSYQGQLGLGLTGDSEIFQILEPIRLDYFGNTKIVDIASGSTYSVFVTERREIFSCGLNDFHQIGIDKAVTVI